MSLATDLEAAIAGIWIALQRETEPTLSRTSASVLSMLADRPRRVTELAAAQAVAQPTMTVALQRLETRGLVTRERDTADRRVTNVVITEAGRQTLARRRAARSAALEQLLAALDPDGRAAVAAAVPALASLVTKD